MFEVKATPREDAVTELIFRLLPAVIGVALIGASPSEAADAGRKWFRGGSVVAPNYTIEENLANTNVGGAPSRRHIRRGAQPVH